MRPNSVIKKCLGSSPFASLVVAPALAIAAVAVPMPVSAQMSSASMQPSRDVQARTLRDALRRLSRNPVDLFALLDAGDASVALDDIEAASGFFTRALEVSANSGRAFAGLGRVAVRRMQPVQALQYFARAERSGASAAEFAGDRGLAYDLVADNVRARNMYRSALQSRETARTRRNLALSHAISGEREAFEAVLLPLLDRGDRAAFRTRAFGLAIMGETEEAVVIAETMMPTDLALRMAPYLRYMPRLTKAQQAAAGALGVFPQASQIGTDSAAIAAYAVQGGNLAANADAALVPSGPAMGSSNAAPARRARPDRRSSSQSARIQRNAATDPLQRTQVSPRVRASEPQAARPVIAGPQQAESAPQSSPAPAPVPELVATTSEPATDIELPAVGTGFDLARAQSQTPRSPQVSPQPQIVAETEAEAQSVADAFSGFPTVGTSTASRASAVDIRTIEPPREVEQVQPVAPQHPARHWVQVATGRDLAALKFDWRRISRSADGALDGKGPFTVPWGQANRLLAGPYESAGEARQKVNELKTLGLDTFPFISDEGQAIVQLD